MPRILLTHTPDMLRNYYGERAVAALREMGELRFHSGDDALTGDTLIAAARGCDIVVSDRQTAAPEEFFVGASDIAAFLRCAVDIRNVDVDAASAAGVLVTHATPGFIASVAEMAIGFMIDLARRVTDSAIAFRAGTIPEANMGRQLAGSTLGIIGYGAIGERLAQLGVALGMAVLVNDPFKSIAVSGIEPIALDALLKRADFVVCLAVANAETENLMNASAFARMQPTAFFINLSRGNLVDEAALERALDQRLIAGAALDVGRAPDQMPPPALARRADVIATPHVAGLTPQAVEHQAFDTVEQVRALVAGRVPQGAVNAASAHRLARFRT